MIRAKVPGVDFPCRDLELGLQLLILKSPDDVDLQVGYLFFGEKMPDYLFCNSGFPRTRRAGDDDEFLRHACRKSFGPGYAPGTAEGKHRYVPQTQYLALSPFGQGNFFNCPFLMTIQRVPERSDTIEVMVTKSGFAMFLEDPDDLSRKNAWFPLLQEDERGFGDPYGSATEGNGSVLLTVR